MLLLLCACALSFSGCASGTSSAAATSTTSASIAYAPGRAMWFWDGTGPNASSTVLGNTALETKMIANMKAWNVTTLYGSYSSTLLGANAATLRTWNAMLSSNGIHSYVLLSNTNYFLPEDWAQAQGWILTNFVDFNAASAPGEGFAGLALDVEPDSFAGTTGRTSWATSSLAVRRTYLTYFLNFLQSSRALLNQNSASAAPIDTALAYWYAQLNTTIGWTDQNDVNQWFAALGQVMTRVSIMDYFSSTQSLIQSRFVSEASLLPAGVATVSLRYIVGYEWTNFAQFWQAVLTSESTNTVNVDLEDYDTMCVGEGV